MQSRNLKQNDIILLFNQRISNFTGISKSNGLLANRMHPKPNKIVIISFVIRTVFFSPLQKNVFFYSTQADTVTKYSI